MSSLGSRVVVPLRGGNRPLASLSLMGLSISAAALCVHYFFFASSLCRSREVLFMAGRAILESNAA
ncbi:hypothetical protein CGRA01v4_11070 [Colletotrichum graminicola]|nr:hypothetical protein CGRA01v4_11070 [Colletotrichum graminicola]